MNGFNSLPVFFSFLCVLGLQAAAGGALVAVQSVCDGGSAHADVGFTTPVGAFQYDDSKLAKETQEWVNSKLKEGQFEHSCGKNDVSERDPQDYGSGCLKGQKISSECYEDCLAMLYGDDPHRELNPWTAGKVCRSLACKDKSALQKAREMLASIFCRKRSHTHTSK